MLFPPSAIHLYLRFFHRVAQLRLLIFEAVLKTPSKHWSLSQLAQEVGMSRTNFANQFKELVGQAPINYLTEWRMSLAYSALQLTKDTILSIALEFGYQSEASFSRAFKRVMDP